MEINKLLTTVNYKKGNGKKNKYIVIHYVGATGGAEANCKYFKNTYRGASAHYFVGHNGEVWQCVKDEDISWHCGAQVYKHKEARNTNSIGVEMCCYKGASGWYFTEQTIQSTITLVKELMQKHSIPVGNVIRHYDVTGKVCPEPYVRDAKAWDNFKAKLTAAKPATFTKDVTAIAKEVIQGRWGNGEERKKKLSQAGYNYNEVQKEVNRLLKG